MNHKFANCFEDSSSQKCGVGRGQLVVHLSVEYGRPGVVFVVYDYFYSLVEILSPQSSEVSACIELTIERQDPDPYINSKSTNLVHP